jgi:two-component system LytT family sensor kinase
LLTIIRAVSTAATLDATTLTAGARSDTRAEIRTSTPGAFHSQVALAVYAIALSLMDGLHMALRVPTVRPPVIWLHLLLGLAFYPLFIKVAVVLTRHFRLDSRGWRRNAAIHLVAGLFVQYLHYVVLHWFLANIIWPVMYPTEMLRNDLILGISANHYREYPIDLLAYWVVIAFEHAFEYYSALGERQIASARLEARLAEARLEVLRRQLSPHFLFNTLNTISVLALRGDKEAVVDTLTRLSDLLRIAIDEDHPQLVPLSDELSFLDGYLGIQQVRFGERLQVSLQTEPKSLSALVPFMMLQPIVENAIEHGTSAQTGGSSITIETMVVDSRLHVHVHDSGPGFATRVRRPSSRRHGIGLANTSQRLQQLYGSDYTIHCGDSPRGGASVEISLPLSPHPIYA